MVNATQAVSLDHALKIRQTTGAMPYAGGTDIMVRYRRGPGLVVAPGQDILFINRVPELNGIRTESGTVIIGAATPYTEILRNRDVPDILKQACRLIGAPAVQNAGTLGGNICNASPAADSLPPLIILDATVKLQSSDSIRMVSIRDFVTGPGTTLLRPDELVTEIHIPPVRMNRTGYRKIGTRKANALSKASFAALADVEQGMLADIRMALGAVSPTVVRCPDLEQLITGKPVTELKQHVPDLLRLYAERLHPITDQRSDEQYRKTVCLNLIQTFIIREVI